jgi:GT2 family glycosyltransferase
VAETGPGQVSVVVPTLNGAPILAELLASLERQTLAHEVVVVDNGSTDFTRKMVCERFPNVRLLSLLNNVGFARAVNRGVDAAAGETLVFLNNDVVCEPTFLERLCAAIMPANDIVMAAGVLLQAREPSRIDTAGIEFDPTLLAFDYLHGAPAAVLDNGVQDPIGPCAGAAAFDRKAFESVGGFDENIFAYLEDVDLVVRLLAAGGRCRLAPDAIGVHRHSATLGPRSRKKNELISWSRGYMIGKYRLHESPGLLARTVAGEAIAALGKVVLDRAGIGIRPRIAGWRFGISVPRAPLPTTETVPRVSFLGAQQRRIRRRFPPG